MYLHAVILLLITALTFAQPPDCSIGSFFTGTRCALCPRGTFSSTRNATQCTNCPPGTFNPFVGARGEDVCRICPRNTTSTVEGATSITACRRCPPGQVGSGSDSPCGVCPRGSLADQQPSDVLTCTPCAQGTYQWGSKCRECPTGTTTAAEGASSIRECMPCPQGTILTDSSCMPCQRGSAFDAETNTCVRCLQGSFADEENPTCQLCPQGTISRFSGSSICVPCPDGFSTMGPGASFCRRIGGPCPAGYFVKENGDCVICSPGFRLDRATGDCVSCPTGFVSETGIATECTQCTEFSIPSLERFRCFCPEGRERRNGTCETCRPGTFKNFEEEGNFSEERFCRKCPPGTFAPRAGMRDCTPCPRGTVAEEEGSITCKRCPPGLVISSGNLTGNANRCVVPATNCPPGFERAIDTFFETGDIICREITCPEGSFRPFNAQCRSCAPGEGKSVRRGCQTCVRSRFSPGGAASCERCPNRFRRDLDDGSKCVCSGRNARARELVDGICRRCRRGFFNDGTGSGDATCSPCPKGTFTPAQGRTGCQECPANTFTPTEGSSACIPCPEGTFSYGVGDPECLPLMS